MTYKHDLLISGEENVYLFGFTVLMSRHFVQASYMIFSREMYRQPRIIWQLLKIKFQSLEHRWQANWTMVEIREYRKVLFALSSHRTRINNVQNIRPRLRTPSWFFHTRISRMSKLNSLSSKIVFANLSRTILRFKSILLITPIISE